MPKNKYESQCVMNKNITDMKAAIKNTVREVDYYKEESDY